MVSKRIFIYPFLFYFQIVFHFYCSACVIIPFFVEPFDDRAINDALECACNANIPIACRYLGLLQNKNAKSEACLKNACEKLEKYGKYK